MPNTHAKKGFNAYTVQLLRIPKTSAPACLQRRSELRQLKFCGGNISDPQTFSLGAIALRTTVSQPASQPQGRPDMGSISKLLYTLRTYNVPKRVRTKMADEIRLGQPRRLWLKLRTSSTLSKTPSAPQATTLRDHKTFRRREN